MRGSKANLVIRQDKDQQYKPTLYIEPVGKAKDANFEKTLNEQMKTIAAKYPGVELKSAKNGWEVIIPEKYKEGHEAHFGRVTEKFLEYLKEWQHAVVGSAEYDRKVLHHNARPGGILEKMIVINFLLILRPL